VSNNKGIEYIDRLLILRGLSSFGVLLVHSLRNRGDEIDLYFYLNNHWEFSESIKSVLLAFYPTTGSNFVAFFFILSGYLMGKVFFQQRYTFSKSDIIKYYRSRFLRIAPLLYFNLIICSSLFIYSSHHPLKAIGDFLFINNITGRSINWVTWTLSYEMQYYLIAPFVFYLLGKNNLKKKILLVFLVVIILSPIKLLEDQIALVQCFNFLFVFLAGFSVNILIKLFPIRKNKYSNLLAIGVGFFVGNLVFYYFHNLGHQWISLWVLVIFAMGTVYILDSPQKDTLTGESPQSFKILFLRFWTWIGFLSYGIYLWHFPIIVTQHMKVMKYLGILAEIGYVFTKWQETLIYHITMFSFVIFLTLLVSLVTFFLIELRYRPSLYSFTNSKYTGKYLRLIFKQ
jgi:peptidoglycan/LPS O-acetylase OafA/YrhL